MVGFDPDNYREINNKIKTGAVFVSKMKEACGFHKSVGSSQLAVGSIGVCNKQQTPCQLPTANCVLYLRYEDFNGMSR